MLTVCTPIAVSGRFERLQFSNSGVQFAKLQNPLAQWQQRLSAALDELLYPFPRAFEIQRAKDCPRLVMPEWLESYKLDMWSAGELLTTAFSVSLTMRSGFLMLSSAIIPIRSR